MEKYKHYAQTVQAVQTAAEQAAGGYHLSEDDLNALEGAIKDLQSLLNTRRAPHVPTDRDELERVALQTVSAANYYDLADTVGECSDDQLQAIIRAGGDEAKENAAQ